MSLGLMLTAFLAAAEAPAPALAPIDPAAARPALPPGYKRVGIVRPGIRLVGAYAIRLPRGERVAAAWAPGYLPIRIATSRGRCFEIRADYVGNGLRNPGVAPADCGREPPGAPPPPAPRAGLSYVATAWGFAMWTDRRAGTTILTRGSDSRPVLVARMKGVGIGAMNSPDAPMATISLVGSVGGRDSILVVGLAY